MNIFPNFETELELDYFIFFLVALFIYTVFSNKPLHPFLLASSSSESQRRVKSYPRSCAHRKKEQMTVMIIFRFTAWPEKIKK